MRLSRILTGVTVLVILLVSAACQNRPETQPTSTQVAAEVLSTATAQPDEPVHTATPTPEPLLRKVILVAAGGSSQAVYEVEQVLSGLAAQDNMTLETRDSLQTADLTPEMAVTVWLQTPAHLNDMARAAAGTVFVIVDGGDLQAGGNVSVVRTRLDYHAFMSGFIVALISPDYRSAGLLPGDSPLGDSLANAFINGGRYYCGICAPGWPLGERYPQVGSEPGASAGSAWLAAAQLLFDSKKVVAYYLSPEAANQDVFTYLAGKDQFGVAVRVVGAGEPPLELQNQWAATVRLDLEAGLRQVWPDAAAGKGSIAADVPVVIENVNADYLGEGKMRLVNELLDEINAGRIYPFTVPAE
jgi:hypothetical protein